MINIPEINDQAMYDHETFFHLMMKYDRLAKFIVHYEMFKMTQNIPGAIVECGVFKGTSLMRFAMMRNLFGNSISAKLIAFDVFDDIYPDTKFPQDKAQREHWIKTAGESSIDTNQLEQIFKVKGIENYELIKGDACLTVPQYVKDNPGLKISLLNLDIDFYEPNICILEHFYNRVSRGGVIILDNYAGDGSAGDSLYGDTQAVDDFFKFKKIKITKLPFAARPCFIVKE